MGADAGGAAAAIGIGAGQARGDGTISPAAASVARRLARDAIGPGAVAWALRVIEALWVPGALLLALVWTPHTEAFTTLVLATLGALWTWGALARRARAHDVLVLRAPGRSAALGAGTLGVVILGVGGLAAGLAHWPDTPPAPAWVGAWAAVAASGAVALRLMLAGGLAQLARRGRLEQRIAVVGGGPEAEALLRQLAALHRDGVHVVGLFDDREDARSPPLVAGVHKLGDTDDLLEFARIARIDMLIVSLPLRAEARIMHLLRKLWVLPVDIRLSVHDTRLRFQPRTYDWLGPVPLLDLFSRPLRWQDRVLKRGFDLVLGSVLMVLALPMMAVIALAVRLDSPGPVLFRQARHGFNNRAMEILKFRTLHWRDADPEARRPVTRNDGRVTRVGGWLRRTSLDELPQLFNVLRGDMSLVGPRPHALAARNREWLFADVAEGYFARHRVKPGITGWAQVNGLRGEVTSDAALRARIAHDLDYIDTWSLWRDLWIVLRTPGAVLRARNAY